MTRRSSAGTGGLVVALGLLLGLLLATSVYGAQSTPAAPLTRVQEPVIVTGNQLPLFDGVALDDLFVYAYAGGTWAQIPFQFDEVDASGAYTVENGLLDAADELTFMAMDLGEEVEPGLWITDADSLNYARYQIQVTNPVSPTEQGWVYVYRSATLLPAFADYVEWDGANNRVVAGTYIAGVAPAAHPGVDSLELNGSGVDALDRTKIRVDATCWLGPIPIDVTLTEEDLASQSDVTPDVDGPVRVGGGTTESSVWSYHSMYQSGFVVDVDGFVPPEPCTSIDINWIRLSHDWLDPAATGMAPATYYDGNTPNGVLVDGVDDSVLSTPANAWLQISGGQGSVVQVMDVALGGGTLSNYYKDDQALDPDDTGDGQSFGDAGLRVDTPSGQVELGMFVFALEPAQPNVGATYQGYLANPLEVTVTAQTHDCRPAGASFSWPPGTTAGEETAFTASVAEGQSPFTYTWGFGDDGTIAVGNPVSHTFELAGIFSVTLTVSNACGIAPPVVQAVTVVDVGDVHLVYLPLVLKERP